MMMSKKRLPILISCVTIVLVAFAPAAAKATAPASTVVAGMVFCDQCKDGARGLFDYPLYGGSDASVNYLLTTPIISIIQRRKQASNAMHALASAHLTHTNRPRTTSACLAYCRRSRRHPVRRRRHPADRAREQHQLVRRLLHPHGGLPGHEPLHRPRRPGHGALRRRHRRRAEGAHPRLQDARPRALHRAAAALAARGGHGLLPRTRQAH